MEMPVEEAAKQLSGPDLDWLFQPTNLFEILARSDPDGTQAKIDEWKVWAAANMPVALAKEYADEMQRILKSQSFYRKIKAIHDSQAGLHSGVCSAAEDKGL
jgi:hypothetical protein